MIVLKRKGYLVWFLTYTLFCINMFTHNLYTNVITVAYFSGVISILVASIFIKRQYKVTKYRHKYIFSSVVLLYIVLLILMFVLVYFETNIVNNLGLDIRNIYYILSKLLCISALWVFASLFAYKKWHKYIVE
jgi:hypothetical protein